MMETYEMLFSKTNSILKEHKNHIKEKGEDFNIFSITKIERYENNTHSAMLSELLNPNGSHHQGNLFLKEFLKIFEKELFTENKYEEELNSFLAENPRVFTEFSIGQKNLETITGGRIDILIKSNNRCIIIENKIDAIYQEKQLERYKNYKQPNKHIFYLTLKGDNSPKNEDGTENLSSGIDYFAISYKQHIIAWLEACMGACPDKHYYLKNGIAQYLNLVKKITYQLKKEYMDQLRELLAKNLEAASTIAAEVNTVTENLRKKFREEIKLEIDNTLNRSVNIMIENEITATDASISLYPLETENQGFLSFEINQFDGSMDHLYIGVFNKFGDSKITQILNPNYTESRDYSVHYPISHYITTPSGNRLHLKSIKTLEKFSAKDYYDELKKVVVTQIIKFVNEHIDSVNKWNKEICRTN